MAIYAWKGQNRMGEDVEGERVASSPQELARILQKEQIRVVKIGAKGLALKIPFLNREKVKLKELLTDAAIEAVRKWTYRPATKNGKPVKVRMTVTVAFKLA